MDTSAPRILIVRLSALGDVIHALPLLGALRSRWPAAHLGWLVEPAGAVLLDGHPMLNAVHVVPRRRLRRSFWPAPRGPAADLVRELRLARYDIAVDVQGLAKSAFWPWMANVPRRIGFAAPDSRELAGWLATERVRPPGDALHVVERNLELLRPLGLDPPQPARFPIHLPEAARRRADAVVQGIPKLDAARACAQNAQTDGVVVQDDLKRPFVIIVLGAGWPTKIWPADRFGRLARLLAQTHRCRVALAWGPGEEWLVGRAMSGAGADVGIDAAGPESLSRGAGVWPLPPTSFMELGALMTHADLVVGGDTGPTHLAAALGVPTVALMGPLDARRNGPYGPHCVTIQHAVPRRAPFWRNHRSWCDPATDLRGIGVEEVFEACSKRLL